MNHSKSPALAAAARASEEVTMSDAQDSWKAKAKRYLGGAVVIALFIWSFSVAQGARSTANENLERLQEPSFDMSLVPGGPERLADAYEDIDNADAEKVKAGEYRWSTLVLRNTSFGNVDNSELTLRTTAPLERVLVSAAGWNNEVSVKPGEAKNETVISLEELQARDSTFVFLGVSPSQVSQVAVSAQGAEASTWTNSYKHLVQSVKIEGDFTDTKLYGVGEILSEDSSEKTAMKSSSSES
jgi:hypothetical protein